ncbi:MAG: DNA translocase FtsK 4TM domain-containing protein [Pseudomonadales bacterium]|nr:DNA translocase FtsK 4TM domain-containing protein [Pseudomonadales bacterium]
MAKPATKTAVRQQRELPLAASVRTPAASSTVPSRVNLALARGVREVGLLLLACFVIFIFAALLTYSSADPGWSSTASLVGFEGHIQNLGGYFGAWLSDILFSLFGRLAYLFPLLLTVYSALRLRKRYRLEPLDPTMLALRCIGLVLVMIAGTGISTLQWPTISGSELPFSSGGLIGQAVAQASEHMLGLLGATLLLLAVFLFGLTIFTDLSWLWLMDETGRLTLALFGWSRRSMVDAQIHREEKRSGEDAREERQRTMDAHRLRVEQRRTPVPVIVEPTPAVMEKAQPSKRVVKEKQTKLFADEKPVAGELPALALLERAKANDKRGYSQESLEAMSKLLEIKLLDFGVTAEVMSVLPGPVITRFEIQPAAGVKASRISGLAKDLARSLAVVSVRVVEVIPGKSYVGIEVPNEQREMVRLGDVLASNAYDEAKSPLTFALGHDIAGTPVMADLAKMPHLLVAGTTGSGKSVGVNTMLMSLLFKSGPDDVRLILVDPKMLELSVYEGIPHLLTPVVTDMKEAANALRWSVGEMERRYKLMAALGVRNLAGYNKKVLDAKAAGQAMVDPTWRPDPMAFEPVDQQTAPMLDKLPYIVIVIDEFADMMMIVGKKVEQLIARIAQKARAAGIHLVLATQRPSVDVITGLIKANIPTRIAFQVSSKIDSRTIIDQGGAEQLLGHGDMLYLPPGSPIPVRVHGAFVDDHEVHAVVEDWKLRGEPDYLDEIMQEQTGVFVPGFSSSSEEGGDNGDPEGDVLYDKAVAFVLETRKASISAVQRKFQIGYNRAARLVEAMEAAGVVSAMNSNGSREVLAPGGHH